jgi:hypothetical protein
MTRSLDRESPNEVRELPLFVRLREGLSDCKYSESSIPTGSHLIPRDLSKGATSPSTPNYTAKTRGVNDILDDLRKRNSSPVTKVWVFPC